MKKLLILLILATLSSLTFAQVQLRIPEVNGLPGTTVSIPVMVDEAGPISALQVAIEYDPAVLTVDSKDSILQGGVFADHSLDAALDEGRVLVTIFSPSLSTLALTSGLLFQIVAEIDFGAEFGSRNPLAVVESYACDSEGLTIGISPISGSLVIGAQPNQPDPGQNELIFAHLANGAFSGGSFQTTIVLVNQSDAAADVRLGFLSSGAQAFPISFTDGSTSATIDTSIPPRGSRVLRSDGSGSLGVGYARVLSTAPVAGTILFEIEQGGDPLTEVGIGASAPVRNFEIPVLYRKGFYDTGIALLNPHGSLTRIELTVKDENGNRVATQTIDLTPHQHLAQFSTQFFAVIGSLTEFNGSIEVSAERAISAVALKQSGLLLTSFPVAVSR